MLAIVDSPRASTYPGSVALALLRCFDAQGPEVLFIDANPSGTALADRLAAATGGDFSPGARGLPTLIAAGAEELDTSSITSHCYRLDEPDGVSPWLLLAPTSRRGAAQSTAWLNEHAESVAALEGRFRLVVASSLKRVGSDPPTDLLCRAGRLVLIAPAGTEADRAALADPFASTGLPELDTQRRFLLVEAAGRASDDELAGLSPLEFAGRLPAAGDSRLLTPSPRLRRGLERAASLLDEGRAALETAKPVGRSKPGRRAKASKPEKDTARAKPAKPAGDTAGSRRAKPIKPGGDTAGSRRAKPAKPAARAKPAKPAKSAKPTGRAKPAKPAARAKPAKPAKPASPKGRAKPAKPAGGRQRPAPVQPGRRSGRRGPKPAEEPSTEV